MRQEIIHGDCLEVMKEMEDNSVDLVLTDPPWNMNFFEDDNKTWANYCAWLDNLIQELKRIAGKYIIFQSTKAIPYVAHLFKECKVFASVKNSSQMSGKSLPNCWDIVFIYNCDFQGNGRNWYLSNTAGIQKERTMHPTQRTLDTMCYLINMLSKKGDLILDPFAGSGTTGRACKDLSRNFILIEKEEKYIEVIKTRLQQEVLF